MRAALYARVSTEDQAEKYGLSSQLTELRELAAKKSFTVPEGAEFVDDGYSGATLHRPALDRLREAVRARAFDVVLVHDPDRLSRKLAHHPVRDAAGQLPSQPGILSFHAPAADDVVAFRHGAQKLREVLRVVLEITIHGDDDVALGEVKPGLQGGGLAEVSPQPKDRDSRILVADLVQQHARLVAAPIVDEDDFVRLREVIEHLGEARVKRWNIFLLVV